MGLDYSVADYSEQKANSQVDVSVLERVRLLCFLLSKSFRADEEENPFKEQSLRALHVSESGFNPVRDGSTAMTLSCPHAHYPFWTEKPLARVASANDLYTSAKDGQEDDTHEKWLNTEFETPAEAALQRAVSGNPMTKVDWYRLVRFIAAQDVRTPVRLLEELKRWQTDGPKMMEETLYELVEKMKSAQEGFYRTTSRASRPIRLSSSRSYPPFGEQCRDGGAASRDGGWSGGLALGTTSSPQRCRKSPCMNIDGRFW